MVVPYLLSGNPPAVFNAEGGIIHFLFAGGYFSQVLFTLSGIIRPLQLR